MPKKQSFPLKITYSVPGSFADSVASELDTALGGENDTGSDNSLLVLGEILTVASLNLNKSFFIIVFSSSPDRIQSTIQYNKGYLRQRPRKKMILKA